VLRTTDFYLDSELSQDDFIMLSRADNEIVGRAAARVGQPLEARVVIYRNFWAKCGFPKDGEGCNLYEKFDKDVEAKYKVSYGSIYTLGCMKYHATWFALSALWVA
jgi:hypothetical protein